MESNNTQMDDNTMDNNVADQPMRKCKNPACGTLLDNLTNFCPQCGAPTPAVYGGANPVTIGVQSATDSPPPPVPPGEAGMLEADTSFRAGEDLQELSVLAKIHSNMRYRMFFLMVCLVNAATVLADLILEHTHSEVVAFSGDCEDDPCEGSILVQLRHIFTVLFVFDAVIGLLAWRAMYLRRNGMLHIFTAIAAVLSSGMADWLGVQVRVNLWGITVLKLAAYIRLIKFLLRCDRFQSPPVSRAGSGEP